MSTTRPPKWVLECRAAVIEIELTHEVLAQLRNDMEGALCSGAPPSPELLTKIATFRESASRLISLGLK